MDDLRLLYDFVNKLDGVYIYGAGLYGHRYYEYISCYFPQKVRGYIVSKKDSSCIDINVPVFEVDKISVDQNEGIIVAMRSIPFSMKQYCFENFHANILFCYQALNNKILQWLVEQYPNDKKIKLVKGEKVEPNSVIYCYNEEPYFRIYGMKDRNDFYQLDEDLLLEYKKDYGELKKIDHAGEGKVNNLQIKIYVVTSHLDNMDVRTVKEKFRIPIQVGAELTNVRKGCLLDSIGDNISNKNREYCEITALYWMWKNSEICDYLGLEHYRRRMVFDERDCAYIINNDIDLVLPIPQFAFIDNRSFILKSLVTAYDWEIVKRVICEYDIAYEKIIQKYENSRFYFSCNIGVMKRDVFYEYCQFSFFVAEKMEKYYEQNNILRLNDRYMGFIFEHLFSIFIMRNYSRFNIVCSDLEWKQ